jgi:hypothetical protein
MNGEVRFRSSKGNGPCRERAEREMRHRPKPSPSTPAPVMSLELSSPGNGWGSSVGCSEWRGEGLGEEWRPGERWGWSRGLYTSTVDTVRRGIGRHGLGSGAARSGWRSELSAWVWSVWSGVKRCRQGQVIFRARVQLVELTPVALVGFG